MVGADYAVAIGGGSAVFHRWDGGGARLSPITPMVTVPAYAPFGERPAIWAEGDVRSNVGRPAVVRTKREKIRAKEEELAYFPGPIPA